MDIQFTTFFRSLLKVAKRHLYVTSLLVFLLFIHVVDRNFPLHIPYQDKMFARIVVDDQGRPLRAFADKQGIWRYPIELEEVSPKYLEALIEYEDKWFWHHPGINPFAVLRALYLNIKYDKIISGGSTLSMQVARLLHPHSRTFTGKLYQAIRTLQLEWHFSKKEILTLYCNIAPFGGAIEGVQAASFTYLDKPASELSYAEAALLAVLPQSPTRLRPDLNNKLAELARNKVLDRMQSYGIWSSDVVKDAKMEHVSATRIKSAQHAPLLARRLINQANTASNTTTSPINISPIKSTIDGDLQASLEDYTKEYISRLPHKTSAAILVVENKTANVKAYLGTADFANDERYGHVDMVQAIRSPGSTLKPFLYAMAMDEGLIHSKSLLVDVPRTWDTYRPGNFNNTFSGPVSVTDALQRSLNLPAIDLLSRVGPKKFVAAMNHAGVQITLPENKPNLATILGGAGTSLEKLVSGYLAFANGGKSSQLNFLQQANSKEHRKQRHFFSEGAAWIVQDILSGVARPGRLNTLAQTRSAHQLAWKTGTSYGFRDSWAIGVNKRYTIGVWVGRPDGTPIPGHSGRATAAPLLHTVADYLSQPKTSISKPHSVTQHTICWPLGTAEKDNSTNLCHSKHHAWVIDDTIPPTWHPADLGDWQNPKSSFWISSKSGKRLSASCETENTVVTTQKHYRTVALWPKVLDPWLPYNFKYSSQKPPLDQRCLGNEVTGGAQIRITGTENGNKYLSSRQQQNLAKIPLKAIGGEGRYHWYINGKYLHSSNKGNYSSYSLNNPGNYQIVVIDDQGNSDKADIEVLEYF